MPDRETLPTLLKRLRSARNLSQSTLAQKAGLTQGYVGMLETGRRPNIGIAALARLADALGADVGELARAAARGTSG